MRQILVLLTILSVLINAQDNISDSELTIHPYGYFKFDMSYDSDLMSVGNFARWALPNNSEAIPTTNITAKESRFGISLTKGDISGKVEIDFYGSPSVENKGRLMLRKAYAEARLKNFTIRAGQDSDVISPLVPSTINYPVAWWAGNIGYRRPMLKLFGDIDSFSWTVALARNIGDYLPKAECILDCADGIDDGSTAILPEFQGRLGFTIFENHMIGFSGHYARQKSIVLTDIGKNETNYESWSGNIDLNLKITSTITVSGEAFVGHNIARMLGGIGNASTIAGVETQGGWINLKYIPNKDLSFSTGFSMDDPCDCDLGDGMRSKNTMIFGNIYQNILQGFLVGFELSHWTTEYKLTLYDNNGNKKNVDPSTVLRGQLAFLYKF